MKFQLLNAEEVAFPAARLAEVCGVELGEGDYVVDLVKCDAPTVYVKMDGKRGEIRYGKICQFNRAFGLLIEKLKAGRTDAFEIKEVPQFEMNGVMFDLCHGNGAFPVSYLKTVIDRLALMGLDTLMLYLEENYEVDGQPRMGYMRPKYSKEMLRETDDYAYAMGLELIPCIQVLAHLKNVLRWDDYREFSDYDDCLLVGDERTEKFVDDVIRANSTAFRSRRIHVGMDEAEELGHGRYLRRFGYENQVQIMNKHMELVTRICEKYGMKPMMWDDMFFKAMAEAHVPMTPENIAKACPKNIQPVYWNYGCPADQKFADHVALSPETIFAGGCWAWFSFSLDYSWTLKSTVHCLERCKKAGIKEVFMTTWGDHGAEAPQPINLVGAQMYAELGYAKNFNEKKFARRFKFCTGGVAKDFRVLENFDVTPVTGMDISKSAVNASKAFMWQDILTGLFDKNIGDVDLRAHYHAMGEKLRGAEKRNGMFNSMFVLYKKAVAFMELKADMGCRLTRAYKAGDRDALLALSADLATLYKRTKDLMEYYRKYWNEIYMPLGWDIFDLRFGGLMARIHTAKLTLDNYLAGAQPSIPELEVERMYFSSSDQMPAWCNMFWKIVSPSME